MKRSGFAVKITAFIEADPKDMVQMVIGAERIEALPAMLRGTGCVAIKIDSRFMLSREVPDATAAAPDAPVAPLQVGPIFTPPAGVEQVTVIVESGGFDGPAFLDASKRRS